MDWERKGWPAYQGKLARYIFLGMPLEKYYCWGQDIYAPCDGVVVAAKDGCAEPAKTNLLADLSRAYQNARYFDPNKDDEQAVAGNYIILQYSEGIFAALVHLQTGSIQVAVGQQVKKGEIIGRVGHSGNSFMPHLHFQLMDSSDIATANGLPSAFEEYQQFIDGRWETVENSVPTGRIRF